MNQKEILKQRIEEQRRKLDGMLTGETHLDEIYRQSVELDLLIEQYLDMEEKITA